ncbi:MAG: tRNA glutamyl-Q synthetase [Flavobacteriales bacterium]|nr:MAG: tRNA glutamyl-Q synthetase [Flavobacteriales bacterium]
MSFFRTRIAPTPSGFLHAGNGINFSAVWQLAKANNGTILLRIDDLDAERARTEYIDDIFSTLEWLGITWQEGPAGVEDFLKNWSQHQRMEQYEALLNDLRARDLLYACDCSRAQVAAASADGSYRSTCRTLRKSLDDPNMAWRLKLPPNAAATFHELGNGIVQHAIGGGDPVVRSRASGAAPPRPAYHVASLVDDHHFGISTVVRGEDLLPSTALQVHLAEVTGNTAFAQAHFLHHPLSTDAQGRKLSKSAGADALREWRAQGRSPQEIHTAARALLTARGLLPDAG